MIKPLHIGGDLVLNSQDIIGIFSNVESNNMFLESFKSKFRLRNISEKNKSFVLVKKRRDPLIYYSKISAGKLIQRLNMENSGGN
ncbi:MAG: DUF370 domain-containing protein [bacterium]